MGEEKWQLREFRSSRSGRNQKAVASNIWEAIEQFNRGKSASDRMKIVVKKEDLKEVLEAIRDGRSSTVVSLDQRLNLMRKRQILRGAKGRSRGSWRPVLQSIPEEL